MRTTSLGGAFARPRGHAARVRPAYRRDRFLGYGDRMPAIPSTASRGPTATVAAVLALAALLALTGCGGDDSSGEDPEAVQANAEEEGGTTPTETAAQPPPESAAGAADDEMSRETEQTLAEEAATGPQPCPDVVITANSGNGLFAVEAEGITCEDASAALQAWGESGYPGEGPAGFACEEVSEGRLSCEQDASGGVVEFDTGG